MKNLLTFAGIRNAVRASYVRIKELVDEHGDTFPVNGFTVERIPDPTGGRLDRYVILGGTYDREKFPRAVPEKHAPDNCAACGVAVGIRRRIVLNGRNACPTCHRLAFYQHDKTARRALGIK